MSKGNTLNTLTNYKPTNLLINGSMNHWQRGTSITGISSPTYVSDRWYVEPIGITTNVDVDRSTDVPSKDFLYSAKITNQSVVGSIPTSAWLNYLQRVYYPDVFKYIGKRVSYSVWVKTNKAGQYNFFMYMGAGSVFYQLISNVTLTSGAWTKVTFKSKTPLPNDITNTSFIGAFIGVHLVSGTDHHQVQSSDWIRYPDVGPNRGATGQVNFCDTIGNEFYITGAMVHDNEDENAPFQYHGADVLDELDICRMYFQRIHYPLNAFAFTGIAASTTTLHGEFRYLRPMLKNPTPSVSSTGHFRIYNNILGNTTLTTFQSYYHTAEQCLLNAIGPGTITGGESYVLQSTNSGAYIDLDAEI
jgi:hypothetical protein